MWESISQSQDRDQAGQAGGTPEARQDEAVDDSADETEDEADTVEGMADEGGPEVDHVIEDDLDPGRTIGGEGKRCSSTKHPLFNSRLKYKIKKCSLFS